MDIVTDDLCARLARDLDGNFAHLVELLEDDVYSGLRRLAGPDDADDLTQETFIRAYQALSHYEEDRVRRLRLRGWIWTIALNLGRNHARDRARRPVLEMIVEPLVSDPEPPDSEAWDRRLERLSPVQRRAVVLRHIVGLDYPEIAEATGRAEGTVKSDVHRGLERLRKMLEEEQ